MPPRFSGGARLAGEPAPPVTVADVKAEARRRIEAIMPPYKQSNFHAQFAEAVLTHGADAAAWPPELQATLSAAMAQWAQIKAIRARSDAIEAMTPIPTNLGDDALWA